MSASIMPSMRHSSPSRGCYGRLMIRAPSGEDEDDEAFHPMVMSTSETRSSPRTTVIVQSPTSNASTSHSLSEIFQTLRRVGLIILRFMLTNVAISVLLIIIGIGVSLGLGAYSFFKLKPRPVIDKSIKAFNIPNHIASRRHDALNVAIKELHWRYRGKRDLRNFEEDFEEQLQRTSKNTHVFQNKFIPHSLESQTDEESVDIFVNSPNGPQIRTLSGRQLRDHVSKIVDRILDGEDTGDTQNTEFGAYKQNGDNIGDTQNRQFDAYKRNGDDSQNFHQGDSESRSRHKRSFDTDGRIKGITQANRRWKMQVVYVARGEKDPNIFTAERLETIQNIEKAIRDHHDYTNFCYISYYHWTMDRNLDRYRGCNPLNSLMTYFYPSKTEDGYVHYDGLGSKMDKINRTLQFAMTHDTFFWYVDDKINSTYLKSRILRTEVPFGAPLPSKSGFITLNIIYCRA